MANERIFPSYPLFVKDPSFSVWTGGELLAEQDTKAWWGGEKTLCGFLKSKGETYCFLGKADRFISCGVKKAEQLSLKVTAFSTDYQFKAGETKLKLRFVSPLLPDDAELISLPVCYLEYVIEGDEQAEISLFAARNLTYNDRGGVKKSVRGDKVALKGCETAFFGLKRQLPLSCNDDAIGADQGYCYAAGEKAYVLDECELGAYLAGGGTDFCGAGEERYICAVNRAKKGVLLLGYDEGYAIDYFGDALKGLYLQDHTIFEGLQRIWDTYEQIDERLARFDSELCKKAKPFGAEYLNVLYASLRQSVAAHKLTRDREGNLLFLSKECCSNGCIATVDVSYPSMPLYLLYNAELVKGMMRPILKFAQMPVWKFDFAPHDVGTYPACCGQVYGVLKEKNNRLVSPARNETELQTHYPLYQLPASAEVYDLEYQMPVEECANMLIMWLGCYRQDGDIAFFSEHKSLADKWVEYLVRYGLKPENQLCTDDFAGHLKNNLNLAIKATLGIAAYAELSAAAGFDSGKYRKTAEEFTAQIVALAHRKTHLPLTWDSDDETFSLKYNFAFDKIFKLGLFPQELLERETDYYLTRAEKYGIPLDSRADYTKSDWLVWTAALTDDNEKQKAIVRTIDHYLRESKYRVPFGDWYHTQVAEHISFLARSVQGGCFILLLQ